MRAVSLVMLILSDSADCSAPGSSVHRILQARILEWVAIVLQGYLPDPGIQPVPVTSPALAGGFFTTNKYKLLLQIHLIMKF